jgi:Spy/CpxP family protein refolding chaperone
MKLTYKIIAGAAATLSLAVAGIVYAHPGGGMGGYGMGPGMGPGMGQGMGPGMGMRGRGPGMGAMGGAEAASERTAQLKAELKITPAQENAWKAYESVVAQHAATMQTMRSQMQALMQSQQPGADNSAFIAHREAMARQHEGNLAARTAALKDLYAVLTPEQRAIADNTLSPMGGPRMGRWHQMR